jgi:diguanylate cyclase (GGDEF)-like protein
MRNATRKRSGPLHQYIFFKEGRLQESPTVRQLLRLLEPVQLHTRCMQVIDRFLGDDSTYALPVVDEAGKPVALIDRRRFVEFFSKPYSRDIFGRCPIVDLLAHPEYESIDPVIVEESCSIDSAAQIIVEAGMQHMVTGFVVVSEGHYLGVANGHDLLNIITQRKQAELYYLAHYDSLTGIPNRALLADRLEHACREAERRGSLVALLFIDVDRFKQINDSLGHGAGDAVLRMVVERLKVSARSNDTIARLGGDEFVILMENLEDPSDIEVIAQRLVDSMQEPIEWNDHSLLVTLSIGGAIFPKDDTDLSPLLAKADAAMYEAKSSGRNTFRMYSPDTAMYDPASLSLENELRLAIERDELLLHFQPQVNLQRMDFSGVEALVRWCHPERGLISPANFIPLAEESGLIVPLGEWVLRKAINQLNIWHGYGLSDLRMSVNISALQFRQENFAGFLKGLLEEYGVDGRQIELELTESALMQDVHEAKKTLDEIKSLGVKLAVDDFGTGFSSLSYLQRFPIDRLKIDQSFVRDIEHSPANESIVRAIVALAESLSLDVVAEGIETAVEKAMLEKIQCREGQGYLFARPLTAEDLVIWANSHRNHLVAFDAHQHPTPELFLRPC